MSLDDMSAIRSGEPHHTYEGRQKAFIHVVHRGERFPIESERAAIYAVLLLRQQPELPLIDAIQSAICAQSYRPENTSVRRGGGERGGRKSK